MKIALDKGEEIQIRPSGIYSIVREEIKDSLIVTEAWIIIKNLGKELVKELYRY